MVMLIVCISTISIAQTISGILKNQEGQAIPNVEISLQQTSRTTTSDSTGSFSIKISRKKRKLLFQHPDYKSKILKVGKQQSLLLVFESKHNWVPTALGQSQQKSSIGYAHSSLAEEQVDASYRTNIYEALQSKVPGLQITAGGGQVGGNAQALLRGYTSINFRQAPLLILDGMPIDDSEDAHELFGTPASNRGMDINPADIASYTILHGPAAAALYGIRASNGAILIQTKAASSSKKLRVNYQFTLSTDEINKLPATISSFTRGRRGSYNNVTHWTWGPAYAANPTFPFGTQFDLDNDGMKENVTDLAIPRYDNNYARFWENGQTQNHHLSLTKGWEKGSVYAALHHLDQDGVIPGQFYRRSGLNLNIRQTLTKQIDLSFMARYTASSAKRYRNASGIADGLAFLPPVWDTVDFPWKTADGRPIWFSSSISHPKWVLEEQGEDWDLNRIMGNLSLSWKLSEKWNLQFNNGWDSYTDDRLDLRPWGSVETKEDAGDISLFTFNQLNWNTDLLLQGQLYQSEKLRLNGLTGFNFFRTASKDDIRIGRIFQDAQLFTFENTEEQQIFDIEEQRNIFAWYGQVGIAFKDWLHLQVNGRSDWVSDLEVGNPALSSSANIAFNWTELLPTSLFSQGTLRMSVGSTGHLPGQRWMQLGFEATERNLWATLGYDYKNVYQESQLRPERTTEVELGTDLCLFADALGINFTWYQRWSKDQIVLHNLGTEDEALFELNNQGSIRNWGLELGLFLPKPLRAGDLEWQPGFIFYQNRSEISDLRSGQAPLIQASGDWSTAQIRAINGQAHGSIYGFPYARYGELAALPPDYLQQPLLIDEDGHPIRQLEWVHLGNITPDWVMSFQSRIQFKRLALGFQLERRQGGDMVNGMLGHLVNTGLSNLTAERWYDDDDPYANARQLFEGVLEDGSTNTIEATLDNDYYSNIWSRVDENLIEDASWWRLRYVYLEYKFPVPEKIKKVLSELNFRFAGRNIWLATDYRGIDPELSALGAQSLPGFDEGSVPGTRSWEFSIGAKF